MEDLQRESQWEEAVQRVSWLLEDVQDDFMCNLQMKQLLMEMVDRFAFTEPREMSE